MCIRDRLHDIPILEVESIEFRGQVAHQFSRGRTFHGDNDTAEDAVSGMLEQTIDSEEILGCDYSNEDGAGEPDAHAEHRPLLPSPHAGVPLRRMWPFAV